MFTGSETPTTQHARRLIALDAPGSVLSAPASAFTNPGLGLGGLAPTTTTPAAAAAGYATPAIGRGPSRIPYGAGGATPRDLSMAFECSTVLAPSWLRGGASSVGGLPSGVGMAPPPPPPPAPEPDAALADALQGCGGPRVMPSVSPPPGAGQFGKASPPSAPPLQQVQPPVPVEDAAEAWLTSTSPDVAARPVLQLLAQYPTMVSGMPANMVPVVLQRLASLGLIVPSRLRAPESELLRTWDEGLYGTSEGSDLAKLLLCRLRVLYFRLDAALSTPTFAVAPPVAAPVTTGLDAHMAQQMAHGFLRAAAERHAAGTAAEDGLALADDGSLVPQSLLPVFPVQDWLQKEACVPVGGFGAFASDNLPEASIVRKLHKVAEHFIAHGLPWVPNGGFLSLNPAWAGSSQQPAKRDAFFKALQSRKPTTGRLLASSAAYWLVPCTLNLEPDHRGALSMGDVFAHVSILVKLMEVHSLRTATYYEQLLVAKLLSNEAPAAGWSLRPYVATLQKDYLEEVRQHDERGSLDRLFQFDDLPSCGYFVDEPVSRKRRDTPDPPSTVPLSHRKSAVRPAACARGRPPPRLLGGSSLSPSRSPRPRRLARRRARLRMHAPCGRARCASLSTL